MVLYNVSLENNVAEDPTQIMNRYTQRQLRQIIRDEDLYLN